MLFSQDEASLAAAIARHARASRRLRLDIAGLRGDERLARAIETSARRRPGVTNVHASARSGRVLIEYAADAPVLDELEHIAKIPRRHARARRRHAVGAAWVAPCAAWHAEPTERVAELLATSALDGIRADEAARRLAAVGENVIAEEAPPSRLAVLAGQLANLPTALLVGSTVVSLLLGDILEAGAIVAVVGLNAAIGYRVERRSESLLAAWRAAELGEAEVIRGGSIRTVRAAELVPGDLLVVRAGTVISADARVVDAHRLSADEAALTGESEPVAKRADASSPHAVAIDTPLAERATMLYRGTSIASGHGRAIVVATGGATEIAGVQRLAAESHAPKGRLSKRLNALASRLAGAGMAAAAAAGLASLAHGRDPLAILRNSVALGVAAIPEGLPVTATSALVRAMSRMRDRGIVVRRLATAEALGGITALCTDKTGTLTENRMRLETISVLVAGRARRVDAQRVTSCGYGPLAAMLLAGVLNSDVDVQANGHGRLELAGSSTERALVEAAQRAGIDPRTAHDMWPRRRLREREEGIHYVVSEHAWAGVASPAVADALAHEAFANHALAGDVAFVKGAPEQVVPLCALPESDARAALVENAALAGDGLRVLAIGWQRLAPGGTARVEPGAWHYLGLVALRDPLREGSALAVRSAASAGIRTIMLTGDQRATAEAIARQARLDGDVIEGRDLRRVLALPDAKERLRRIAVIARVVPADKVAVVEALRRHGEIVAMAGDGINDAPALRAADVGIAVGARSSDLARQTADVVLEREDLRSILDAVAEGRAVQDNLRRSIRFQAAGNLGELLLALGAAAVGRPLIPSLGLLWINLLTDTLPGLALALEPTAAALLDRPPAPPLAPILDRSDWRRIARDGAAIAAISATAAVIGGPLAAFATIGTTQFGYAAACRAPDLPIERRFAAMVGGSAVLHLLAVASAPARALFRIPGTTPIALATSGAAMAVPLYLAWHRHASRQITRYGTAKEKPR